MRSCAVLDTPRHILVPQEPGTRLLYTMNLTRVRSALLCVVKFTCTLFVCLPQFLSGEVLGILCQHCGPDVYVELQSALVSGIENNIERDAEAVLEHPELLEKLSHSSSSSSASNGNERVSQI